jgi:hypothetical protein
MIDHEHPPHCSKGDDIMKPGQDVPRNRDPPIDARSVIVRSRFSLPAFRRRRCRATRSEQNGLKLEIIPQEATTSNGDTVQFIAMVRDANGTVVVPCPTVTWGAIPSSVAIIRHAWSRPGRARRACAAHGGWTSADGPEDFLEGGVATERVEERSDVSIGRVAQAVCPGSPQELDRTIGLAEVRGDGCAVEERLSPVVGNVFDSLLHPPRLGGVASRDRGQGQADQAVPVGRQILQGPAKDRIGPLRVPGQEEGPCPGLPTKASPTTRTPVQSHRRKDSRLTF